MFITPEELNGGVMQISSKLYILLEQVLRCLIYVGIGHTAFETPAQRLRLSRGLA